MSTNDVFVSIAGGLKLAEPSLDLPMMVAIVSSLLNKPVDGGVVVTGEVGLSGEVRGVTMVERRVSEAARMGFKRILVPKSNLSGLQKTGIEVSGILNVSDTIETLL
jgi:DNA repair protein RadA/Sms